MSDLPPPPELPPEPATPPSEVPRPPAEVPGPIGPDRTPPAQPQA